MGNNLKNEKCAGFDYPVTELVKYIRAGDLFTIMLKNRTIIHHTSNTKNADFFEKWLGVHEVFNINPEEPYLDIMKIG